MQYCAMCRKELIKKQINGSECLVCSDPYCDYVHWNTPVPLVACIVEVNEMIALTHNIAWPPNSYSIVTGRLEAGEKPVNGAIRTVKEELNLESFEYGFLGHYPYPEMNQLLIAYHLKARGEVILSQSLDDYKFVKIGELKSWDYGPGLAVKDFLSFSM